MAVNVGDAWSETDDGILKKTSPDVLRRETVYARGMVLQYSLSDKGF